VMAAHQRRHLWQAERVRERISTKAADDGPLDSQVRRGFSEGKTSAHPSRTSTKTCVVAEPWRIVQVISRISLLPSNR
jgi:hypothetical protein